MSFEPKIRDPAASCRRIYEAQEAQIDGKRQNAQLAARLSRFLRDEVAHIVQDPADVSDEIRYLSAELAESELT